MTILLLLSLCFQNAWAQSSSEVQKQVDSEVSALLAEIESKTDRENSSVSQRAIYSPNSKVPLGHVPATAKFTIINNQPSWSLVRFNQPLVLGWLSKDFVSINHNTAEVTASILNLRNKPSISSVVIDRLPKGYSTNILAQKNGFIQVLAPADITVAIKKKDALDDHSNNSINKVDSKAKASVELIDSNRVNNSKSIEKTVTQTLKPQPKKSAEKNSQNKQRVQTETNHIIAPGDAISLLVYGEDDLSIQNVRVPQSGQVSLPLIGSVYVAGKTTIDVERDVYKLLSEGYVRNPRLSVSIFSYRPIFIRGAVRQTGSFPFTAGLTISKAIALAGGSKNSAKEQGVSVFRDGQVVHESLAVDSQIEISSGDVISVSEEFGVSEDQATYVYLHGEVASPGEYLYRRGLTVEKAIVLAGGFTLRASRKKVSVTRYVDSAEGEKPEKLKKVRLYTPVQPGDIIDVGASWF